VTAPGAWRRRRDRIVTHGCQTDEEDRASHDRIPVTSVARTLLDLAEVVDRRRLERAFEAAERMRLLDLRAVEQVCERGRGRRGLRQLRALLPSLRPAPTTRSDLERDFLDFCRDHELPIPTMNADVAGFEVDALWPQERLVVELDGFEFHRTRAAFERDRARDAAIQLAGHRVVRLTHRRLETEPHVAAAQIRSFLRARDENRAG
jgi:very-short-patch-repair endonuclease